MSQRHPEFNMLNKAKLLPLITCLFQVSISQQMASLFIQLYKSKLPGPTLKPVPPSLLHIQSITKSCWLHVPKSSSVRPFSSVCTPRLRSLLLLLQWSPSSIFRGCELATTVGACKNITFSVFSSSPSWTPAALLAHRDAQWPRSQGQSHQGNSPVITSLVCCHWDLSFPTHILTSVAHAFEKAVPAFAGPSDVTLRGYFSGATREWATHLSLPLDLLLKPPALSYLD